MSGQEDDPIIEMLDSIEAAISEDGWPPITAPPPSLGPPPVKREPSERPAPALPAIRGEMRVYKDAAPPRIGTGNVLVRGTATEVLSRFKWGIDK